MWTADDLTSLIAAEIGRTDAALTHEQAVYGLDALDELALHAVVARGLEAAGFGVFREQHLPGAMNPLVRDSARERCDIVLTPSAAVRLIDPLAVRREAVMAPLFALAMDEGAGGDGASVGTEDAFWLEVKTVAQYAYIDGVPQPDRSYGSRLVRGPSEDLLKLAREERIVSGGALMLLFGSEEAGVRHDLGVMVQRMIDRDVPIASPSVVVVPIMDRAGNAACGVCVVPLRAVR